MFGNMFKNRKIKKKIEVFLKRIEVKNKVEYIELIEKLTEFYEVDSNKKHLIFVHPNLDFYTNNIKVDEMKITESNEVDSLYFDLNKITFISKHDYITYKKITYMGFSNQTTPSSSSGGTGLFGGAFSGMASNNNNNNNNNNG